jgi:N-acetylmuramoyl-L-alanine amidase
MRTYVALSIAVSIFLVPWLADQFPAQREMFLSAIFSTADQVASVIGRNPRTIAELQAKYNQENPRTQIPKVRILIVPGHEPNYGGAEFGMIKERDMTVELANYLATFTRSNSKYDVIVARDGNTWNPPFEAYFKNSWNEIVAWQKENKQAYLHNVARSGPLSTPKVYHNAAPDNVAFRLYGLTKWSNENAVDIVLHIHFNDYPGHGRVAGEYSGISIYTPEKQYANGTTTRAVSEAVFNRLKKYNPVSDLPGESEGIVEERELIAIGANDTADAASLLIEYGYIYETQFQDSDTRTMALKDLAFQTYLGLEDFFNPTGAKSLAAVYDTLILPYTWSPKVTIDTLNEKDAYALQTALVREGVYPPANKTKNDCPRTGKVGGCTRSAVESFQKKYGIKGENGLGIQTVQKLNQLYSVGVI